MKRLLFVMTLVGLTGPLAQAGSYEDTVANLYEILGDLLGDDSYRLVMKRSGNKIVAKFDNRETDVTKRKVLGIDLDLSTGEIVRTNQLYHPVLGRAMVAQSTITLDAGVTANLQKEITQGYQPIMWVTTTQSAR